MMSLADASKLLLTSDPVSLNTSFDIAKKCAIYLRNSATEHAARELVIRVLDAWPKIPRSTHSLWNDLVEAAGLYPYVRRSGLGSGSAIRYEFHKSSHLPDVYHHEEQNQLAFELLNNRSVVLSAPTSFGKSLLIEEMVASRKYSNIVIVQPTLALLV